MQQNSVFLREDDIIEIQVVGDQTSPSVKQMGETAIDLAVHLRAAGKPVLILDDLRQIGSVTPDGRHAVVTLAKTIDYDRLVMVGNGSLLRLGANLMLRAVGKAEKIKYFEDYEAAVHWLQQT